jgi:hypothetical protein
MVRTQAPELPPETATSEHTVLPFPWLSLRLVWQWRNKKIRNHCHTFLKCLTHSDEKRWSRGTINSRPPKIADCPNFLIGFDWPILHHYCLTLYVMSLLHMWGLLEDSAWCLSSVTQSYGSGIDLSGLPSFKLISSSLIHESLSLLCIDIFILCECVVPRTEHRIECSDE